MEILYIAHCVPWPPDKGERIRAFHTVSRLVQHHDVHVACLARDASDAAVHSELLNKLSSFHVEPLNVPRAILRGFGGYAKGGSFTSAFHASPSLRTHIRTLLETRPIGAVVVLSSSMAAFIPDGVPFIADWGDVDSEKRFQYARMRFPGFAHRLEAHRMRMDECRGSLRAERTFFTTKNELGLFASIEPRAVASVSGNGVDTEYFNPQKSPQVPAELSSRKYLLFVGVLDYFPNTDGVLWFADNVFPKLRQRDPELQLVVVGRNPTTEVRRLADRGNILITGSVKDVRPFIGGARAVIAPLRIARGVQNKVLEALAMGKRVLASAAICKTFEPDLPVGVECCRTAEDYVSAAASLPNSSDPDLSLSQAARQRFSWSANLDPIVGELAIVEGRNPASEFMPHARVARTRALA